MKRVLLLSFLLVLLLAGCQRPAPEDTIPIASIGTVLSGNEVTGWSVAEIHAWQTGVASPVIPETENLPVFPDFRAEGETVTLDQTDYRLIPLPDSLLWNPCGWQVRLDKLTAIGKSPEGKLIYTPADSKAFVICLYDVASQEVLCYLREDIFSTEPRALKLDHFHLYADGGLVQDPEDFFRIWQFHIGDADFETGYPMLDAEPEKHCLTMVHRDCPALYYTVYYEIREEDMLIYNTVHGHMISVQLTDIP